MTRGGQKLLLMAILLAALPLHAQQDDRIQQLEKKLDELTRQIALVRDELNALKTGAPKPEDDLTKIDVAPAPPVPAAAVSEPPAAAAPVLTEIQTVDNTPNPGAAKVFNPDTSVVGNFAGKAGRFNPYEFGEDDARSTMALEEAEVAFEAFVDPYAKAKFFLAASPEGLELEEGYAQFVTLPFDLTAKVGKMKALFGKANTWHTHIRPWVDQPLVIHNFFGDEGVADSGISVSKVFPNRLAFVEATAEVYRGDVENVFEHQNQNDLFTNAHLKVFKDLTENSNVEVGGSFARGTVLTSLGEARSSSYRGIDITYRWKPLDRGLYHSLIARFEGIVNGSPHVDGDPKGFYASLDYQIARRWFAGLRYDAADRLDFSDFPSGVIGPVRDRGASATLTFWPSEFSQFRTQLRRISYGDVRSAVTELLFQLQFSIGAHGAHTF